MNLASIWINPTIYLQILVWPMFFLTAISLVWLILIKKNVPDLIMQIWCLATIFFGGIGFLVFLFKLKGLI